MECRPIVWDLNEIFPWLHGQMDTNRGRLCHSCSSTKGCLKKPREQQEQGQKPQSCEDIYPDFNVTWIWGETIWIWWCDMIWFDMIWHMSSCQSLRPLGTVSPGHWYLIHLDTIMKLSGTIGVTQKTVIFDIHVCQIFEFEALHPAS